PVRQSSVRQKRNRRRNSLGNAVSRVRKCVCSAQGSERGARIEFSLGEAWRHQSPALSSAGRSDDSGGGLAAGALHRRAGHIVAGSSGIHGEERRRSLKSAVPPLG